MAEYQFLDEAEKVAANAIENWHPHLRDVKIAHLAKIKAGEGTSVNPATGELIVKKKRGRKPSGRAGKKVTMAKTSLVSPKTLALAVENYKFIIEYDPVIWRSLTIEQQLALVDHELCHCGVDADGCYMKHHDLEEFRSIVTRHGFWKDDVKAFAESTEDVYHATGGNGGTDQGKVVEPEPKSDGLSA